MPGTRRRVEFLSLSLLVYGAVACGDSDAVDPADAAPTPDASVSGAGPSIPWMSDGVPTSLAPCPEGWREVTDDGGVTTCEPFGPDGLLDCPDGQAHFPGQADCRLIGPPCPADGWPADLPSDRRVVYVMAGATAGDGSRAAPYGSPAEFAWGGLPAGTIIAIGRGTYDVEMPRITRDFTLWGACATETVLTTTTPTTDPIATGVLTVRGGSSELRALRIANPARSGITVVGADTTLRIEGVWLDGALGWGVLAVSGSVTEATDFVVARTRVVASLAPAARGVGVQGGARLVASRLAAIENDGFGLECGFDEPRLELMDSVVRDTLPGSDLGWGWGLTVAETGQAHVERTVFDSNRELAIQNDSMGSHLTIEDSVIRNTAAEQLRGVSGIGLSLESGARVDGRRLLVEHSASDAVAALFSGSHMNLIDAVLRDCDRDGTSIDDISAGRQAGGTGVKVQDTASEQLSRLVVERCRSYGVAAMHGGQITASDILVRGTRSNGTHLRMGRGIGVETGGQLMLERGVITNNQELGVMVVGMASATLADVVIEQTAPNACGETGECAAGFGMGIGAYADSTASVTRFLVRSSALCGVQVAANGELDLSRGEVSGNAIGACVQVAGYDLDRLSNEVAYRDNGTSIEITDLPIPEPATSL